MEDTTTTEVESVDTGVQETQPVEQTETEAEVSNAEAQTDPAPSDSSVSDESLSWLKSKGIDPSDPQSLSKVADMYRNAEKQMHSVSQAAKQNQLRDQVVDTMQSAYADDPTMARLQTVEAKLAVQDFFVKHPDAPQLEADMSKMFEDSPVFRADGSADLDALYAKAKLAKTEATIKEAEERGRTAARQEIARESTASLPAGQAAGPSSTTRLTATAIDAMSPDEYVSRRDEIQAAIQAGHIT